MLPTQWGPPIWTLFHTLLAKINETSYHSIGHQLFSFIKTICKYLPCPDCSNHATQFLNKINMNAIKSKQELINVMYVFHNIVNKRKKKPLYPSIELQKYNNNDLIQTYNNFAGVYQTTGNMKLMTDSFQRQIILNNFKKWFIGNLNHFDK